MKNGRYIELDFCERERFCWYLNDKYHREDGPAIEYIPSTNTISPDFVSEWYFHGLLHRENGPAVVFVDGRQAWYQFGKLHREDGPAWISKSGCSWYFDDKKHREDGPAVEYLDGTRQWYLNGHELTEEEFNRWLVKKALNEKLQSSLEPKHKDKKNKI